MRGENVVGWYDGTIEGGRKMVEIRDLDIALVKI